MKKANDPVVSVSVDLSFIIFSFIIAFSCILIRNDAIGDVVPGYAHIRADTNMLNYLITQEANFLMIVSALAAVFIAVNAVMLFITKRKASGDLRHGKKCLMLSFGVFIVNITAVFLSGMIVAGIITSGEIIGIAKNSGEGLPAAAHNLYFLIDIMLIIFLAEVIAALTIKKAAVYDKLLFIIFSSVPFIIYPLIFV